MTEPISEHPAPDALLLIAPGCPHCQAVLSGLSDLVKEGTIGALEIVNIAVHPERAQNLGIRSVPWTRLGPFRFEGALTLGELRKWIKQVHTSAGQAEYLRHLVGSHRLAEAEHLARQDLDQLRTLIRLMGDPDTSMHARIGIASVLEELGPAGFLKPVIPELGELSQSSEANLRGDACHFLGLTGSSEARPFLEACLNDSQQDVAEIARESLELLEPA